MIENIKHLFINMKQSKLNKLILRAQDTFDQLEKALLEKLEENCWLKFWPLETDVWGVFTDINSEEKDPQCIKKAIIIAVGKLNGELLLCFDPDRSSGLTVVKYKDCTMEKNSLINFFNFLDEWFLMDQIIEDAKKRHEGLSPEEEEIPADPLDVYFILTKQLLDLCRYVDKETVLACKRLNKIKNTRKKLLGEGKDISLEDVCIKSEFETLVKIVSEDLLPDRKVYGKLRVALKDWLKTAKKHV